MTTTLDDVAVVMIDEMREQQLVDEGRGPQVELREVADLGRSGA